MCGKKQKWGQGRLVFHCQPGVLPKIQQYTECRRVCPLLKGMIQLPVQWKQAEIPKIFPSFCLLIYCTQLPHAMLSCPSRTLPPALVSHTRYLRGSSCTGTSSLHPIQKLLGKCYNAKRNVAIIWHRSG